MRLRIDFGDQPQYDETYLALHKKFELPLHGLTPEQTRFFHYAFRNEINVFFRTCDLSGEKIISQFPPHSPFKVYRHDLWWSKDFGVPSLDYDPNQSFFQQFHHLQLQVPRMSIACDTTMENSPYVNCANHCKNCYMIFASGDCEDCFYCINTERSQTTMDASIAHECTLCYEIVSCRKCYNLDFSANCRECFDSQFLYDCRRCKNCFLCVGLVGKEYCILNKQYSPESYEKELKKYLPMTHEIIDECYNQLQKLRNSYIHKYANIDKWSQPSSEFFHPTHPLDQWILSELHELIQTVTEAMDDYNLTRATRPMLDFVDNLSNWYVRRSRRRFWKSENDADKFEAYQSLYIVLTEFSKLLAPFMPFLADEIYKNLTQEESVHLADWPTGQKKYIKPTLNEETHIVRQIVGLGHAVRDKANIKVRQPLSLVQVGLPATISPNLVLAQQEVICEELNVKKLEILHDVQKVVKRIVTPNARLLGPKYGKDVQEIIKKAKAGEFEIQADGTVKIGEWILQADEVEGGFKGKEGFDVASMNGLSVILDTNISQELKHEGFAREIVRSLQDLRKEAGYQVDDRIYIFVQANKPIDIAVTAFADYIKHETLAIELQDKDDFEWDKEKIIEIEGVPVKIAVRK